MPTTIEEVVDELRDLRAYKAENDAFTASLEKKLEQAERTVRQLREKVSKLESRPAPVDSIDEEFLWEQAATLTFRPRFGGGRMVTLSGRGRTLARLHAKDGVPLLRAALEEASGRKRGRKEDQAPTRPSQGNRPDPATGP